MARGRALETTLREYLRAHPPRFIAHAARLDAVAGDLGVAHDELAHTLACTCGARRFRVLGVPTAMTGGRTSYVLRSVLRVWRELSAGASRAGELAGRLTPPIMLECTACSLRTPLQIDDSSDGHALPPLEALRCRPCRRSTFEAVVASRYADLDLDARARGGEEERLDAWRLIVRCRSCHAVSEPFGATLRGHRQRRLDRLYGRDEVPSVGGPTR